MSDEVAKLAEKLGEVKTVSYVNPYAVNCKQAMNPSVLEALARVALAFCEEREAQSIPIGEYKDTIGSAYFASVARSLEKSGAKRAAFYIRKGAELLKSEEEPPCPPKKRGKK